MEIPLNLTTVFCQKSINTENCDGRQMLAWNDSGHSASSMKGAKLWKSGQKQSI
jgi:hypothetical protein